MDEPKGNGDLVAQMWSMVQELRKDGARLEELVVVHHQMLADMQTWHMESREEHREVTATLKVIQQQIATLNANQTRHEALLTKHETFLAKHEALLAKHDVVIDGILEGTRGLASMMQTLAVTMKGFENRVQTLEARQ